MLDPAAALRARRGWKFQLRQQRESAVPVDKAQLKLTARTITPDIDAVLAQLHRDGVAALEGYWPAERCAVARAELDHLMAAHPECVRHFSNNSDKRVFGAENAGPACAQFHDDSFLKSLGEIEGGLELYNFATLGARIDAIKENRGSGDGWHRDAFGYQFKAILYLCDVTDDNGPFEYVPGSHRLGRVCLDSALGRYPVPPDSRIDRQRMNMLLERGVVRPKRFTAKAGTVILANTVGVHGGAPLTAGHRYALTNYYYYPYQIGQSLVEKFVPLAPGVLERLKPFLEGK